MRSFQIKIFPVLLSDMPGLVEVYFFVEKGFAYTKRKELKTMMLNKDGAERIVQHIFRSSRQPLFAMEYVKECFQGKEEENVLIDVMKSSHVISVFARYAVHLWLKDSETFERFDPSVPELI